MQIVSNIETYFARTGKIRDYAGRIANNSEIISLQIKTNGLQQIFLPQNSLLDSRKIRAVQVMAQDQQVYAQTSTGTTAETLPVADLVNFQLTFAKDNDYIAVAPFSNLHTASNGGKYYFIDSEIGKHRIGDCFINQVGAGSFSGRVIVLQFWYD